MLRIIIFNFIALFSLANSHQSWDSTQRLVYSIGKPGDSQVFVHFDNQTLDLMGNKNFFKCVSIVNDLTNHCIDIIAIQFKVKKIFSKYLKDNQTQDLINGTAYNETAKTNSSVTSKQLICCVLNELFDCMDYTIRKECNDNAFTELKQIHSMIAEDSYKCKPKNRTEFCDNLLHNSTVETPEVHSGSVVEPTNILVPFANLFICYTILYLYEY